MSKRGAAIDAGIQYPTLESYVPESNPTSKFSDQEAIQIALAILEEVDGEENFQKYSNSEEAEWILCPILYAATKNLDLPIVEKILHLLINWLIKCPPGDDEKDQNKFLQIGLICMLHIIRSYPECLLLNCAKAIQSLMVCPPITMSKSVWQTIAMIACVVAKNDSHELYDFLGIIMSSSLKYVSNDEVTIQYFNTIQKAVLHVPLLFSTWRALFDQVLTAVLAHSYKPENQEIDENLPEVRVLKSMLNSFSMISPSNIPLCQQTIAESLEKSAVGSVFKNRWSINEVLSIFGRILLAPNPSARSVVSLMSIIAGGYFPNDDWNNVLISYIIRNTQSKNIEVQSGQIGELYDVICNHTSFFMKFSQQILNASTRLDCNFVGGNAHLYAFLRSLSAIVDAESPGIFSRKEEEKIKLINNAVTNIMWLTKHQTNHCHQLLLAVNTFDPPHFVRTLQYLVEKDYEGSINLALHITAALPTFDPAFFIAVLQLNDFIEFLTGQIGRVDSKSSHAIPLMHLLYEISENTPLFDNNKELRTKVNMFSIRAMKNSENEDITEYASMLLFSVSAQKKMNMSARAAKEVEDNFNGHIGYFQLYNNLISILTDDSPTSTIIIRSSAGIVSYKVTQIEPTHEAAHQNLSISEEDIKNIPNTGIFTHFKSKIQAKNLNKDVAVLVRLGIATADNTNKLFPVLDPRKLIDAFNPKMYCCTSVALFRVTANSTELFDINTSMKSSPAFERFLGDIASEMLLQSVENYTSTLPLPIGDNGSFKYAFVTPALFTTDSEDKEISNQVKTVFEFCKGLLVQIVFNESISNLTLNKKELGNKKVIVEIKENSVGLYCVKILSHNGSIPEFFLIPVLMTASQLKLFIDIVVCSTSPESTFSGRSRHISELAKPHLRNDMSIKPLFQYLLSPIGKK